MSDPTIPPARPTAGAGSAGGAPEPARPAQTGQGKPTGQGQPAGQGQPTGQGQSAGQAAPASPAGEAAAPRSAGAPERTVPQRATPVQPNTTPPPTAPSTPSAASPAPASAGPATASSTAASSTAPQPLPARAETLPPELARAVEGSRVSGVVRGVDDQGRITLQTAQGAIRVSPFQPTPGGTLPPGTRVTLEIRTATARDALVRLLLAPAGQETGPVLRGTGTEPRPTVPLAVGRIGTATVVPGSTVAAASGNTSQSTATGPTTTGGTTADQAAPGRPAPGAAGGLPDPWQAPRATPPASEIAQRLAAYQSAQTARPAAGAVGPPNPAAPAVAADAANTSPQQGRPTAGTTAAGGPAQAAGASAAGGNTAGQPTAASLRHGAVLTVRLAAIGAEVSRLDMTGRTPLSPTGLSGGQPGATPVVQGTIVGVTGTGRPVVQTPFGHLALDMRAEASTGTRLALDLLGTRGENGTHDRPAPLTVLAREWPALDEMLRVLEAAGGAEAATQAAANAIARPGPQLTAAILFLMTALRGGDPRALIRSEAARTLEQSGRGGLLGALNDDVQTLARATEPGDSGWRAFLIPFGDEETHRQIRLLIRHGKRDDGGDGEADTDGTAFLVDLELSRIGPFRLDGFARKDLVDLLVRTTRPLPAQARADIQDLFRSTLESTGITGHLRFRAAPVLPPLPIPELEAGAAGDTTTVTA